MKKKAATKNPVPKTKKKAPKLPAPTRIERQTDTADLGVVLGCFDGPDEDGWYYTEGGSQFSPEDL